ncbi:hypothetical protein Q8A67_004452 [Cirrhinus molitorella]|uniref:Ig-like domain-containing protein n=1 Tax=Cirrhinus molitorella TaxID=172907 RepID=A0AA88Q0H1_9TELE|nr:hypothetical protein Q8A67_004452 [Cirrhinus molitorella]
MQMLHPPAVLLIMVVFISHLTFLTAVTVKYPHEMITKTEGLLLSLKCTVEYKTKDCDIQTTWWYKNSSEQFPIMDPNRYLIRVNETERAEHRLRNIFLTISSLKLQDSGSYQCDATCLNSGTQAKGHFVHLNVTGLS